VMMVMMEAVRQWMMMVMVAWRRRPMAAPRRRQHPSGLPLGCPLGVLDVAAAGRGDEA
jgi:hypothetical protein